MTRYGDRIKIVSRIIKRQFTNLTVDQTIDLAVEIVTALDEEDSVS